MVSTTLIQGQLQCWQPARTQIGKCGTIRDWLKILNMIDMFNPAHFSQHACQTRMRSCNHLLTINVNVSMSPCGALKPVLSDVVH